MQQIYKITQPFLVILALCYYGECWACAGIPGHTQQILHDLLKGYRHYKTIFCRKVALDAQLMNFFF